MRPLCQKSGSGVATSEVLSGYSTQLNFNNQFAPRVNWPRMAPKQLANILANQSIKSAALCRLRSYNFYWKVYCCDSLERGFNTLSSKILHNNRTAQPSLGVPFFQAQHHSPHVQHGVCWQMFSWVQNCRECCRIITTVPYVGQARLSQLYLSEKVWEVLRQNKLVFRKVSSQSVVRKMIITRYKSRRLKFFWNPNSCFYTNSPFSI